MATNKPKGTEDLLGQDAVLWEYVRDVADAVFTPYGYSPVFIPTFEVSDVFVHGIGTATDVVRKEMFQVLSPDGYAKVYEGHSDSLKPDQRLALRPEGTAGVVRAAVEHNLVPMGALPAKLWYAGSMFRAERPQKGRLREFHQIGVECLGASDPRADAEIIIMFMRFIEELGIRSDSVRLLVNSIGDDTCRPAYRESVRAHILAHADEMCEECLRRAETNPLRAFDCKNEACRAVMSTAPRITDALCDECKTHYQTVLHLLDTRGIAYEEDPHLVRGLDYYTRSVFEVQVIDGLGAQNAIGGGGRYDKLVEVSGGKPTCGLGFAAGFERLVLAMRAGGAPLPEPIQPDVYIAVTGQEVQDAAFSLAIDLRDAGLIVESDCQNRSLKSQFKAADKYGVRITIVVGPDELNQGMVTVRDMASHSEELVALDELGEALGERLFGDECCNCADEGCSCGHHHDSN